MLRDISSHQMPSSLSRALQVEGSLLFPFSPPRDDTSSSSSSSSLDSVPTEERSAAEAMFILQASGLNFSSASSELSSPAPSLSASIRVSISLAGLGMFYLLLNDPERTIAGLYSLVESKAWELYRRDVKVLKLRDAHGVDLPPSYQARVMLRDQDAVQAIYQFSSLSSSSSALSACPPSALSGSSDEGQMKKRKRKEEKRRSKELLTKRQTQVAASESNGASPPSSPVFALASSSPSAPSSPSYYYISPSSSSSASAFSFASSYSFHYPHRTSPDIVQPSLPNVLSSTSPSSSPSDDSQRATPASFSSSSSPSPCRCWRPKLSFHDAPPRKVVQNKDFCFSVTLSAISNQQHSSHPSKADAEEDRDDGRDKRRRRRERKRDHFKKEDAEPTENEEEQKVEEVEDEEGNAAIESAIRTGLTVPLMLNAFEEDGTPLTKQSFSHRSLVVDPQKRLVVFFLRLRVNSYYGRRRYILRVMGDGPMMGEASPLVSVPLTVCSKTKMYKKRRKKLREARQHQLLMAQQAHTSEQQHIKTEHEPQYEPEHGTVTVSCNPLPNVTYPSLPLTT